MLELFKVRLKAKSTAAGANLSQKRIDEISDRLHKKFPEITEESEHDSLLDELNDLQSFAEIAKFDDWQRAKEAKEKKGKEPDKKEDKKDEPVVPGADDTPAWAKSLIEQNKSLNDRFTAIETEKTKGAVETELEKRLKDVPKSVWAKRVKPETLETVEAFVTEVNDDYKTDFIEKGLVTQPVSGAGGKAGNGKATKEEVKNVVDGIMPKN